MERLTRESENSDMIWFVDRECEEGDKIILREPCEMNYHHSKLAIKNLAEYEKMELEPQQIKEIDKLYAEKCKEVAELKAEIEKLKQNIIDSTNDTYSMQELDHNLLTKEIAKLKAELEQSIKLPCKISDIAYCVDFENEKIDESVVNDITYYALQNECSFDSGCLYFFTEDIGKCVFLTREEANKALAEMKDKNE